MMLHTRFINRMHHMGRKEHYIISIMLRDFGMNMVEVFVPVILLIQGFELLHVALFMTLGSLMRIFFQLFNPLLYRTIGVQHTLVLSYFIATGYIVSLNYVSSGYALLIISATIYGLSNALFWPSRHIDTLDFVKGKRSSARLSYLAIASMALSVIAPFVGGILAEYMSPAILLAVVFGVMISATIVLSGELMIESGIRTKHKPDIWRAFEKSDIQQYRYRIADNFQGHATGFIWPIYIYLAIDSPGTLGGILALSSLLIAFMFYATGKARRPALFARLGVMFRATAMALMPFTGTVMLVTIVELINAMGFGLRTVPYNDFMYNGATASKDPEAHMILSEASANLGKVLLWGIFSLFIWIDSYDPFTLLFLLAIVPTLGLSRAHR